MIRNFRDAEAGRLFRREGSRRLPPGIVRAALRKLTLLDSAESLMDLGTLPGNRLERLTGNRKHQHSIRINDPWRICFEWHDKNACDVEIVDDHR